MTEKQESNSRANLLKGLSHQDFLSFGVQDIAYIRHVQNESGKDSYAIHAADGTSLSVMDSVEAALVTIHNNDLDAVRTH